MRPYTLIFVIVCSVASAQTDDVTRKLQIAQNLERSGEWKQAAVMYEDLFNTDTTNYVFFDALRRAYAQLKEYDKAIDLVGRRIRMRPSESYLYAFLGGIYFDAGLRGQADSVWRALLEGQMRQRQLYVLVAQQMQERRLFGRAIETYQKGRAALGNKAEFAQELAMLHSATQAYGDAVAEYILMIEQTPHQLGYVQSRIASFTIQEEGLRQAEVVVARAVISSPQNIQVKTLYAWILMEQGRYADALPVYREIDALSRAKGQQLFSFASMAVREKAFTVASQAYGDIIGFDPPVPLRPQALYGMAEAFENKLGLPNTHAHAAGTGSTTAGPEDSVLSLYRRVIQEYPGTQIAAQALFRTGNVLFSRTFDLDGARRALTQVRADPRAGHLRWEALLVESDVMVAGGDVDGARTLLEAASGEARSYLQDRFLLQLARLTYYRGDFQRAVSLLETVTRSLNGDAANDALELTYHINDASSDSATLMFFARGEILSRQRKHAEALQFYERVGSTARTAMLVSRARIASAEMLMMLGKPRDAARLLDSVVTTYQTDVLRDRALYRLGVLYEEHLSEYEQARKTFEQFLVLFPTSLYADDVRRRVRELRRDVL